MRRRWVISLLAAALAVQGEIIDRTVATVGTSVVTVSDVQLHLRILAFLDHQPADLSMSEQRKAVDRLVEQALIRREVELSRYTPPDMADVDTMVERLRKSPLEDDAVFQRELAIYGITDDQIRQALLWQLTLLRFIEYRFRPGVQVSDAEVNAYYQQEVKAKAGDRTPPALDDVRDDIEKVLTSRRVDEALNHWLEQARAQVAIRIHEEDFR